MTTDDSKPKVVPIGTKLAAEGLGAEAAAPPKRRSAEAKWGRSVMERGFVMVPAILLRGQRRLGLTPTQLAVLLQLIGWWTDADTQPWSAKSTLAQRIGISERQLQRQVAQLEKHGLVQRVEKVTHRGKRPNTYDLSGLVKRLQELAPEFRQAKAALKQVEKPGGLKVTKAK